MPGLGFATAQAGATLNAAAQTARVVEVLDAAILQGLGDDQEPVLLFSGGVDSGFLAARLKALGRRPLLMNYAFAPDDPESALAEKMAAHLGLPFIRMLPEESKTRSLSDPGGVYPQPFSDTSVVPTSDLARQVVARLDRSSTIVGGVGADGLLGMGQKVKQWRSVYRIPSVARSLAKIALRPGLKGGRLEPYARLITRAASMPLTSAVIAQNPYAGLYYVDRPEVHAMLHDWMGKAGFEGYEVVGADLALTCANIFAQKDFAIYENAGHRVVQPFLLDTTIGALISDTQSWDMTEPKAPLKSALADAVPRDMVYRRKAGFTDPKQAVFFEPTFLDHLSETRSGPIAEWTNPKAIMGMLDRLRRGERLPTQTENWIWAVTFTDRWYRTAR